MAQTDVTVIYETVHGSRAYGLATETSDTDLRGVFVLRRSRSRGFVAQPDQVEPAAERVLYEIRKFFRLAAACNPTVIEVLFTDPQDHVTVSAEGRLLLDRRSDFLSRLAGDSFRQVRPWRSSIGSRRAGAGCCRRRKPTPSARATACRSDRRSPRTSRARPRRCSETDACQRRTWSPNFLSCSTGSAATARLCVSGSSTKEWTRSRNPARAELERRYGYDTKHAMHLIRLLRMAVEVLSTGEVVVRRPDAEDLRAVRRGA